MEGLARPLLHAKLRSGLAGYDPGAGIAGSLDANRIEGRHPLEKAQYTWIKTMLEGQILNWGGDRVDMANSMESRPAFLDHHLAELSTQMAPQLKIRNGVEKWVLKEAVKNVVVNKIYQRKKFAFMAPPAHLDAQKEAALQSLVDRYMSPARIQEAGLLDPAAVEQFLLRRRREEKPADKVRLDCLLNHTLCLQILHDQFVAGNRPLGTAAGEATPV
jgi:asparagine synthase (glutamine-hydrolysing)